MNYGVKCHAIVINIDKYNKEIKIFSPNLDYITSKSVDPSIQNINDNEGTYYIVYFKGNPDHNCFNILKEDDLIFIKMGPLDKDKNLFEMHEIEIFNENNKKDWLNRLILSWKHVDIDVRTD